MASPDTLELASLLAPIPGERPAGRDLRQDSPAASAYYRLKDARVAARAKERAAESDPASIVQFPVVQEWGSILKDAPRVLATESKDLEVAVWLTEALLRHKHFAGLRDGLRLLHGLVEAHWDGLYPSPDEEGVSTRLAPIAGIAAALVVPIQRVPLTAALNGRRYAHWHSGRTSTSRANTDGGKRPQSEADLERFKSAVAATPDSELRDLVQDLRDCLEAIKMLGSACDARADSSATNLPQLQETLESVLDTLLAFAGSRLGTDTEDRPRVKEAGEAGHPGQGSPARGGVLRTREEAFRELERVAQYFRAAEPHSPLSYVLDQAVRWGRMPLPELLDELITENSAREHIKRLTGIPIRPKE